MINPVLEWNRVIDNQSLYYYRNGNEDEVNMINPVLEWNRVIIINTSKNHLVYVKHSKNKKILSYSFDNTQLILVAGDVERNPGPESTCPCEQDELEEGTIRCEKCQTVWHEACIGIRGTTPKALKNVTISHCIMCIDIPIIKEKIANKLKIGENESSGIILKNLKEMEQNILDTITKNNETTQPKGTPYKEAMFKNLNKKVEETNRLMKVQIRNSDANAAEEKDLMNRTKLIRKPLNVNITNSQKLRAALDKCLEDEGYLNIGLNEVRITAGGSYKIEFEKVEEAQIIQQIWKKEFLGGNSGMVNIGEQNQTGIVKFVHHKLTEEEMEESIEANYPGARYELFKKDGKFLGLIKVTFKEEQQLKEAIENKFKLCNRLYMTEKFKHKPRVIKCNICQGFGHTSVPCRRKLQPNCAKCGQNHETVNCTVAEDEHKCFHCNSKEHKTGSYKCKKVQEILEGLTTARQDGEFK